MTRAARIARRIGRTLLLLCLVAIGTVLLVRFAPGYFSDDREMDARYARSAQSELQIQREQQGSLRAVATTMFGGWMHGSLGQSRQYAVPVSELMLPRLGTTLSILLRGIAYGWLLAICTALPLSTLRRGGTLFGAPFTLLLAVPTGAMATLCLLSNKGGPALVLALLLAARDFKFLQRALRAAWQAPHLLQARAQGLRADQLLRRYVLPSTLPQIFSLATISLVTALSAIVPIEVIFAVPGIGQLAWTAAMNRDLPVLLAVTLFMAIAVVLANAISQQMQPMEAA